VEAHGQIVGRARLRGELDQDLGTLRRSLTSLLTGRSRVRAGSGLALEKNSGDDSGLQHNRERGGVCSTMFADRTAISETLPIFIQPNKKFKIPKNPDQSMIMIGPGTGIAPFRGFLHERRALGHKGSNWLFFGERSRATDFLYREEVESMLADGHLTRLDTAFSRDQEHKMYVQDRMMEQAPMLWSWLNDGASIYVCGDARQMAKDVDRALRSVIQEQGKMDTEESGEFMENLKSTGRYHRDVY